MSFTREYKGHFGGGWSQPVCQPQNTPLHRHSNHSVNKRIDFNPLVNGVCVYRGDDRVVGRGRVALWATPPTIHIWAGAIRDVKRRFYFQ